MTREHSGLHDAIDEEVAQVEASADALGNDEPEREPLETRLHSLHEAVAVVEGTTHRS